MPLIANRKKNGSWTKTTKIPNSFSCPYSLLGPRLSSTPVNPWFPCSLLLPLPSFPSLLTGQQRQWHCHPQLSLPLQILLIPYWPRQAFCIPLQCHKSLDPSVWRSHRRNKNHKENSAGCISRRVISGSAETPRRFWETSPKDLVLARTPKRSSPKVRDESSCITAKTPSFGGRRWMMVSGYGNC